MHLLWSQIQYVYTDPVYMCFKQKNTATHTQNKQGLLPGAATYPPLWDWLTQWYRRFAWRLQPSLALRTANQHWHKILRLMMMHGYTMLVAKGSEVHGIWKKQLLLEDISPHRDLDLEDRNPNFLHSTPGHYDTPTYQVSGWRVGSVVRAQEKLWVFPSEKGYADSLSVCPTPVCICMHTKDHVRTLKIL